MKQSGFAPILIVVLIAALAGGYFVFTSLRGGVTDEAISPTSSITPTPTTKPESTSSADMTYWKTYTSSFLSFSLKYPPSLFIDDSNKQHIEIQNYDPATEPYEGYYDPLKNPQKYSISISKWAKQGIKSLEELRNSLPKDESQEVHSNTKKEDYLTVHWQKDVTINGYQAIKRGFHTEFSSANEVLIAYLLDGKGLVISIAMGSDEEVAKQHFEQILSTFKFLP